MNSLIFIFPGNEAIGKEIISCNVTQEADWNLRSFPDGETYMKVNENVKGKTCFLLCSLNNSDQKLTQLFFLSKELRSNGAKKIVLICPYLGYLRQDKRFSDGEVLSSVWMGELISNIADEIITIDPHLHRIKNLDEICTVPSKVLSANVLIGEWIRNNIDSPVIIGPDEESDQWARSTAKNANCDFLVLKKTRKGDRDVIIEGLNKLKAEQTPVLVDDIISTARTMSNTVRQLLQQGSKPPVCIGVHALFSEDALEHLEKSGTGKIVTCNSIRHQTNAISLGQLIAGAITA